MSLFDKYHEIAARLLGRVGFPLPLPEWDRNYPHNVGLLSHAEEAELAATVINYTQGLTLESWQILEMDQRLPWMRFAVEKVELGKKQGQLQKAEILISLGNRVRAKSPIVTADDLNTWPDGLLRELVTDGILTPIENAKSVACDSCDFDHVEVVEYIKSSQSSELRAFISCPTSGRAPVSLARLGRWIINLEKFQSPADQDSGPPVGDEPLAERAQLVLIAMLELEAFDSDQRKTTAIITSKALGETSDANALKGVMAELKTRGLVKSKKGSGGGFWLSVRGTERSTSDRGRLPQWSGSADDRNRRRRLQRAGRADARLPRLWRRTAGFARSDQEQGRSINGSVDG